MSIDPTQAVKPIAADIVCSVHDYDIERTHELLTGLSVTEAHAVIVLLAASLRPTQRLHDAAHRAKIERIGRVAQIAAEVADRLVVDTDAIYSRSRAPQDSAARHVVCWVAVAEGITTIDVGKALGRDHSTVISSCARVTQTPALLQIARSLAEARTA